MKTIFLRSNHYLQLVGLSWRIPVATCLILCASQNYAFSQSSEVTLQNVELSSSPTNTPQASEVLSHFFFGSQRQESSKLHLFTGGRQDNVVPTSNSNSVATLKQFFGFGSQPQKKSSSLEGSIPIEEPFRGRQFASSLPFYYSGLSNQISSNDLPLPKDATQGGESVQNALNQFSSNISQASDEVSKDARTFWRQNHATIRNTHTQTSRVPHQISEKYAQDVRKFQRRNQDYGKYAQEIIEDVQIIPRETEQRTKQIQLQGHELTAETLNQVSNDVPRTVNVAYQNAHEYQSQGRQIAQNALNQIRQTSVQTQDYDKELNKGRKAVRVFENQSPRNLSQASPHIQSLAETPHNSLQNRTNSVAEVDRHTNETLQCSNNEIVAARRRRLNELNALLATKRPDEFARRTEKNRDVNSSDGLNVDQANRSQIRLVSNQTPSQYNVGSTNLPHPTPPMALQTTNNRSISTKASALPRKSSRLTNNGNASNQRESTQSGSFQKNQNNQSHSKKPENTKSLLLKTESKRSTKSNANYSEPAFDAQESEEPGQEITTKKEEVARDRKINTVIRSSAKFIDPKDL